MAWVMMALLVTGAAVSGLASASASTVRKNSARPLKVVSHPFKGPTSALKPWNPNLPAGPKPPIPKLIAFSNQADTGFFLTFQDAAKLAASRYGIPFISANAAGDAQTQLTQVGDFLQRGIGGLEVAPVSEDLGPEQLKAIRQGIFTAALGAGYPTTTMAFTNQYQIGNAQGLAAAQYIDKHMGGQAQVVYINANKLDAVLIARQVGAVNGLKTGGPGVKIVADVFNVPGVVTGDQLMTTLLQAHPNINVVVGDDESVLGAWNALKAAGKASQVKYLSGINGSPDALAVVAAGNTPYKADFSFGYAEIAYNWSIDFHLWLEGKSVPLVERINPVELTTAAQIAKFNHDAADPAHAKLSTYETLFGNIDYATRMDYVDYQPLK